MNEISNEQITSTPSGNGGAKRRVGKPVFRFSFYTIVFLVVAALFLAFGLGTLGSVRTTGKAYELRDGESSAITFRLSNIRSINEETGAYEFTYLRLKHVYVNIAAIYVGADEKAKLTVGRGASDTAKAYTHTVEIKNLYTDEVTVTEPEKTTDEQTETSDNDENADSAENTETTETATKTVRTFNNTVGNWIEPFDLTNGGKISEGYLNVESYKYVRIYATGANFLINEVVFVGEKVGSASDLGAGTGEYYVIPAFVYKANPVNEESTGDALVRASALIDTHRFADDEATYRATYTTDSQREEETLNALRKDSVKISGQYIPSVTQTSYYNLGYDEVYSMMTIAEMRQGSTVYTSSTGVKNVYHADEVYNSFGTSVLALGVAIFGNSPFGLRFFPMLCSFLTLVVLYFFVREHAVTGKERREDEGRLKADKAGLIAALLYALSAATLSLGHLGTPLMVGVFFFMCSLYCCYLFFRRGMKLGAIGVVPLVLSGICGAFAICVNGAFVIPMIAVVGLFAAGLVRQIRTMNASVETARVVFEEEETAIRESEEYRAYEREAERNPETVNPVASCESAKNYAVAKSRRKYKNTAAPLSFFAALIVGTMFLSLVFLLPVYNAYVKYYDNPLSPSMNAFALMAKLFAGGFVGVNGGYSAWNIFYREYVGTGSVFAVTAVVMNPVAFIAGLLGIAYAVYKIVRIFRLKLKGTELFVALYRVAVPLGLIVISLIAASFGGGALAFMLLSYMGAFVLAADCIRDFTDEECKHKKWARIVSYVGLGLLIAMFALFSIVTLSVPLPASFMVRLI